MTDKNPYFGATFAERKAIRLGLASAGQKPAKKAEPDVKQVDDESPAVEDKAMKPAESKRPARKKS